MTVAASVILSPHFDDAVLSCWHVLVGPGAVRVVDVFGGSPCCGVPPGWWDRCTGATDSVARIAERVEEDRRALVLAGRAATRLEFLDEQYRHAEPPLDHLVAAIGEAVGGTDVVYAPAALGSHPDHRLVRDAALELWRCGATVVLYADVPHALAGGWPAWVTGRRSDGDRVVDGVWRQALRAAEVSGGELVASVHALDAAQRVCKLTAVRVYATQLAGLDRLAGGAIARPDTLGFEVTWSLDRRAR